jgi:hypothetical protein
MKCVTTIRGQNAQLPNVKADGTHNYHKARNIYTLTAALSKPPSILKRQIQRFSYQHNFVCVCVYVSLLILKAVSLLALSW